MRLQADDPVRLPGPAVDCYLDAINSVRSSGEACVVPCDSRKLMRALVDLKAD